MGLLRNSVNDPFSSGQWYRDVDDAMRRIKELGTQLDKICNTQGLDHRIAQEVEKIWNAVAPQEQELRKLKDRVQNRRF